ncbi:hypothetical protein [Massilia alkalitolerans]|uniref:hypothetical protein n=1 Tax=Massilia alkalitolerans TaxID=286638 RepID=UPI00040439B7|nr:hypothetical protein [Massilia alkalitolerans]
MSSKLSDAVCHQIGGGWGEDDAAEGLEKVAIIRGTDIPRLKNGDFSSVPLRFEKKSKISQRLLQVGDLVIETSGGSAASGQHTGRALHVTKELLSHLGGKVIPASFCKLVRLDARKVSPSFCAYLIDLMHLTGEIAVFENQSTGISNFQTTKFLESVEPVLALTEQEKVSKILGTLDSLRLTLFRQNSVLESAAQVLFRTWFMRYDPVHSKALGSCPEAMSPKLAAVFPAEFEPSDHGALPAGWTAGALSDLTKLCPESWTSKKHPDVIKYIDLSGLKKNTILAADEMAFADAPSRARRVLRKGDSVYGTVRPGNLSYGFIGEDEQGLTGSTGFAVLRPTDPNAAEFVYCAMTLKENIERLTHLAEGAAYPAVRPDVVHAQELTIPSSEVLAAFHAISKPMFEFISLNCRIIATLEALRDRLLPLLITGRLAPNTAEVLISEAMAA